MRFFSIISSRSLAMCVPLWHDETVMGLIYVDNLIREHVFSEDDLTLLTSLANVAAIKLENARLLDEMIEKKRMERELELAGDIQQGRLPSEAPSIEGGSSSARTRLATRSAGTITILSSERTVYSWPLGTSRAKERARRS